jgi:hypothetical protein
VSNNITPRINMVLAGAEIRNFNGKQEEGQPIIRFHFKSDLTKPFANAMKWDALFVPDGGFSSGWKSMKLPGKIQLEGILLEATNLPQKVEVDAAEVRDFVAKKDETSVSLDFIVTMPKQSLQPMWEYWLLIGEGHARMVFRLSGNKQESIDFTFVSEEDPSSEESSEGPALASRLDVIAGGSTAKLRKARGQRRGSQPAEGQETAVRMKVPSSR